MQPIPRTAAEALAIYRDPESEVWERDYASKTIGDLEEGREALLATARDTNEDEMLQQRAAECLSYAWRDQGVLMTADVSGFTPTALQEIFFSEEKGHRIGASNANVHIWVVGGRHSFPFVSSEVETPIGYTQF